MIYALTFFNDRPQHRINPSLPKLVLVWLFFPHINRKTKLGDMASQLISTSVVLHSKLCFLSSEGAVSLITSVQRILISQEKTKLQKSRSFSPECLLLHHHSRVRKFLVNPYKLAIVFRVLVSMNSSNFVNICLCSLQTVHDIHSLLLKLSQFFSMSSMGAAPKSCANKTHTKLLQHRPPPGGKH